MPCSEENLVKHDDHRTLLKTETSKVRLNKAKDNEWRVASFYPALPKPNRRYSQSECLLKLRFVEVVFSC